MASLRPAVGFDGISVCHRCDNPRCVRVDHLWLGTPGDNNRDCWAKGGCVGWWGVQRRQTMCHSAPLPGTTSIRLPMGGDVGPCRRANERRRRAGRSQPSGPSRLRRCVRAENKRKVTGWPHRRPGQGDGPRRMSGRNRIATGDDRPASTPWTVRDDRRTNRTDRSPVGCERTDRCDTGDDRRDGERGQEPACTAGKPSRPRHRPR